MFYKNKHTSIRRQYGTEKYAYVQVKERSIRALTEQTVHKNRSLLAFTSQFEMTVTAVSAADADEDGSGSGDDGDRLSSVRVLLSSICFLVTSLSHSVHINNILQL